jgi:hypothetical protein
MKFLDETLARVLIGGVWLGVLVEGQEPCRLSKHWYKQMDLEVALRKNCSLK